MRCVWWGPRHVKEPGAQQSSGCAPCGRVFRVEWLGGGVLGAQCVAATQHSATTDAQQCRLFLRVVGLSGVSVCVPARRRGFPCPFEKEREETRRFDVFGVICATFDRSRPEMFSPLRGLSTLPGDSSILGTGSTSDPPRIRKHKKKLMHTAPAARAPERDPLRPAAVSAGPQGCR